MGNLWSIFSSAKNAKEPIEECDRILEQYASHVLDFSSQYGSERSFSYTARNCLGMPSKFPSYGDFPQTYVPRFIPLYEYSPGGQFCSKIRNQLSDNLIPDEFIDLQFKYSVDVHAIYIYETLNPGSIESIWGGDCKGQWQRLWINNTVPCRQGEIHAPRQFCPPIRYTDQPINQIRLYLKAPLAVYSAIDAVCLLGTLPNDETFEGPIYKLILEKNLHVDVVVFERSPMLDKLPQNLTDEGYFSNLPREIILFILSHLDFRSQIQCSRVSKNFLDITSDALLYRRLELKKMFNLVSNATLKSIFRKAKLLKYLDLSHCGNYGRITSVTLRTFIYARGSKLTNLILSNCHATTKIVLMSIGRTCQNLVDLDLSNLHFIETGNFEPLSLLTNLQQLNFYRTRIGTHELLHILSSNASTLRAIYLGSCLKIDGDNVCEILATECEKLAILDLWRCASLTSRGITLLSNNYGLLDLDFGWCVNVLASTGCIRTLVQNSSKLRRLMLTSHRQTSDSDIEAISQLGATLEQFSCMGSRNVSPESILDLALSCQNLQLLDISFCDQLESQGSFHSRLNELLPQCNIQLSVNDI